MRARQAPGPNGPILKEYDGSDLHVVYLNLRFLLACPEMGFDSSKLGDLFLAIIIIISCTAWC